MAWSIKWQLTLNPAKCEAINISNKCSPINMDYHIECQSVSWTQRIKYLGVIMYSILHGTTSINLSTFHIIFNSILLLHDQII